MRVTKDKVENSQAFLTIEAEPAEVEESLEKAYHHLVKKANIPGFRKGKAPRSVLERHLGKDYLFDEALNQLFPVVYEKAIGEQELKAIAKPEVQVEKTEPVIFKVTVPLMPTVELGDYHSVRIEHKPVEVTEEQIDTAIDNLRHQHATWEPVERGIEYEDLTTLDMQSNIDGKPLIDRDGFQYQVFNDAKFPAPGFPEQLLGMKAGEEKEFKLTFPQDYSVETLQGKEASFKVKVSEVKKEVLPELNDDFARQVDSKFDTMESLKKEIAERLKEQFEEKAREEYEDQTIDAVAATAKVEFPPVMVEVEIDRIVRDFMERNRMKAEDFEAYLQRIKKTPEEFHEEMHPVANKRVVNSLVLGKIMQQEKIEVSDSDIDAEIEQVAGRIKDEKDADTLRKYLSNPESRESIRERLLTRKTIQFLVALARGENSGKIEEEVEKK